VKPVSSVADHELVLLNLSYARLEEEPVVKFFRDLKRIDVAALEVEFRRQDWSPVYLAMDSNSKVAHLQEILMQLLDRFAPLRSVTYLESNLEAGDSELLRLVEMRETAYVIWRSRRNRRRGDQNWQEFKRVSRLVDRREETLKKSRIEQKFNNPGQSLKDLWKKLKSEGLGKQSGKAVTSFTPDQFNGYFAAAPGQRPRIIFNRDESYDGFSFGVVEEDEVFKTVMSMTSDAIGADGFPLKFIKLILLELLPILTHVLSHAIMTSSFPSLWKTGLVIPIPKTGGPTQLSDFRPISILPVLSKVLEKLLYDQMVCYLTTNNMLSRFQSRFRGSHSTATALAKILDDIHLAVEVDGFSVAVLWTSRRLSTACRMNCFWKS
jgi:Reverse transcriptase (RNA-dependent DNA polymerase)